MHCPISKKKKSMRTAHEHRVLIILDEANEINVLPFLSRQRQMMKALSGKYGSIFPNRSRNRESVSGGGGGQGIVGGTAKHNRSAGDDKTDTSRRRTFPLEQQKVSSSSKSLVSSGRASASDATPSSGGEVAEVSTSSRPSSRGRTPSKAFF